MKILGFILVIVGLVLAAISKISLVSSKLTFIPSNVLNYGSYVGVGVIVIGIVIFALTRNSTTSKQVGKEVPIYQGNKIVGYRKL